MSKYINNKGFVKDLEAALAEAAANLDIVTEEFLIQPSGSSKVGLAQGTTLATYLRNSLGRTVTNVAELKALSKVANTQARSLGYYSIGDGGAGTYFLDPTDTTTADNGGTCIVATDGGRWKLITNKSYSIRQFGARGDGVTNDDVAFARAFAYVASLPEGGDLNIETGTYKLTATISWNQRRVKVNCAKGAVLDFQQATGVDRWVVRYVGNDSVEKGDFNTWEGGDFQGPPASVGLCGLFIDGTGTDSAGSFVNWRNVTLTGFKKQVGIGSNVAFTNFHNFKMRSLGGEHYQTEIGISVEGVINTGECITFTSPQLGALKYGIYNNFAGMADGIEIFAPGIDYCKQAIVLNFPMNIKIIGGHWEMQDLSLPGIVANGNGCTIEWEKPSIWVLNNVINGYFVKTEGVTLGGVFIDKPFLQLPTGFNATTYALTDPASDLLSVSWTNVRTYAGQEHVPAGLPQSYAPPTATDRFRTHVTASDGGDASVTSMSSATTYRNLATTRISTSAQGQEIKKTITIPTDYKSGIPTASMMIKAEGFVSTQWLVSMSLWDKNNVLIADFGNTGYLGNTDFKFMKWYLQSRVQGVGFVKFNIYAAPQAAGETARSLYLADCAVNVM